MTPVKAVKVEYDYPIGDNELMERFQAKIREVKGQEKGVKLGIFDTIVNLPGVRMLSEKLTEVCREEKVLSCIDVVHGVGHIPIDLGKVDADFFVSNCHKYVYPTPISFPSQSNNILKMALQPPRLRVFHVPLRNQHLIRSSLVRNLHSTPH